MQKTVHMVLLVLCGFAGYFLALGFATPVQARISDQLKQRIERIIERIEREDLFITEQYHQELYQRVQTAGGEESLRLLRYLLDRQVTLAEEEKALAYTRELMTRAEQQNNERYLAIARLYDAYFESLDDSFVAPLITVETELKNAGGDWMVIALAHRLAAKMRAKVGQINFALDHVRAGLEVLPENNTDAKDIRFEMMNSLRYIYGVLSDPDGVINTIHDLLDAADAANRRADGVTIVYALTLILSEWQENDLAFQYSQTLEQLAKKTNSDIELFYAYYLASRMAHFSGAYLSAIDYADKANALDIASPFFRYNLDLAQAGSYAALGMAIEARLLLDKMRLYIDEHPDIKDTERGALLYSVEADLAVGEGRYEDAITLYKQYQEKYTGIIRREFSADVKELRASLESSLAEEKQRLARLQRENRLNSEILRGQKITLSLLIFLLFGAVGAFFWQRRASGLLKESRKQAEAGNKAKSDFLATMSHEIRTPINGVLGFTNLLLDDKLTEEQRNYAQTIKKSGEALLAILNDVLDLSKIEAGEVEFEELEFDITEIVESVTQIMSARAHSKGIELASFVPPDIPKKIIGDPGRIRQILLNLVNNAVKFTGRGGVSVLLSASDPFDDGSFDLRFDIRDTGIGIPADKLHILFKPFTQADASTTRKFGGTGLGLSISQRLTRMMGGQIGVESTEGEGSLFWFTVRTRKSGAVPAVRREMANCQGLKVLVADDNPVNLEIFLLQLESAGIKTVCLDNGKDAFETLKKATSAGKAFDVLLTDHMMPDMSGVDLAKAVHGEPALQNLHIILCTSSGHMKRSDAAKFGFDGWLAKPVQQELLYRVIAKASSGKKGKNLTDLPEENSSGRKDQISDDAGKVNKNGLRILLAEDQPINQMVAVRALSKAGFTVDVAGNGFEAVEAVRTRPYDLVLMDIQMPEMDGMESCKRIRALDAGLARVPIIALTANTMPGDKERYIAAGMNDYISKPIDFPALIEKIHHWVAKTGPVLENSEPL